jgi:hypothetical protein
MRNQFLSEAEMLQPVIDYFVERGYDWEVEPLKMGKIPDLFCWKDGETVAIELKLSDWKKASYQATIYRIFCNRCYVAFPIEKKRFLETKLDEARKWGFGILLVGRHSCEMMLEVRT